MHKDNLLIRKCTSIAGFMGMVIVLSACGPPVYNWANVYRSPRDVAEPRTFCTGYAENEQMRCLQEYEARHGYRPSRYFMECYAPYIRAVNECRLDGQ